MRGDSLRDLYAKVLALCGLGLLAGAGALVDYWPVQEELPRVARRPDPSPVVAPPRVNLNARVVVPAALRVDSPAPLARPRAVARHTARTLRALPPSFMLPTEPAPGAILNAGSSVRLLPPPAYDAGAGPAPAVLPLASVTVTESRFPRTLPGLEAAPLAFLEAPVDDERDNGFLSGAFKKTGAVASASLARTGDALVKGGAVAGASIVDMFRGLAGAMKKVSPFVP